MAGTPRFKGKTAPVTGNSDGTPTALTPAPSGKRVGKVGGHNPQGEYTVRHRKNKRQKRAH
jgi:hypothetical protein